MSNNYGKWIKFRDGLSAAESDFIQTVKNIDPGISEQVGVCGNWSIKQVVAHITGWEKEVIKRFRDFSTGKAANVKYDIDDFNRRSVESRSNLSWNDTVKELEAAQQELQLLNDSLDEQKINKDKKFVEWTLILLKHYKHHNAQLKGSVLKKL